MLQISVQRFVRATFIEDLDPDTFKISKKSYKNNLIYYIWYVSKCAKFCTLSPTRQG